MDYLFTPWRYAYITGANAPGDCLFCTLLQTKNDEQALIVHRAKNCFVMLNAFPYTSGHAMVVPYDHVDELTKLSQPAAQEMMALTQRLEGVLVHVRERPVALLATADHVRDAAVEPAERGVRVDISQDVG